MMLICIIICICVPGCAESITLEEKIVQIMDNYQAIGLTTVVVRDNKICYTNTFGYNPDYNDSTLRNPIPDDGIYYIASISKTFISTAIMQLVEGKKIKLDDDVNKYMSFNVRNPKYPTVPITIRMLLCHRSSINHDVYALTLDLINPQVNKDWSECYNDYAPGEQYEYCNYSYCILGAIIENVTGERLDDYVENHITKPLGLYSSYNLNRIDSNRLIRAYYFEKDKMQFRKSYHYKYHVYNYSFYNDLLNNYKLGYSVAAFEPTGGIKISAVDLAKYMMMHMNYGKYAGIRIISRKSEREMRKPQMGNPKYGLAFSRFPNRVDDVELEGMVGFGRGVHSSMLFNAKKKYGFVVISNGDNSKSSDGQNMNTEIIRCLYKYLVK